MTHLKLRLLACAATVFLLQQPRAACAQSVAATAATPAAGLRLDPAVTQLPHISIATAGRGSPVVFIPGLSSPRTVWTDAAAMLAKTHQVILVQINGFAGDGPGENLASGLLNGAVADLHGYLAKRKLTGVPVVGHSMGGLLTLMLAKAHPGDVGRGMIVDALPFVGTIFVPGSTPATLEPQAKAIRDRMAASYGQAPNLGYVEGTANGLALTPGARAQVKAWMLATDARVSAQALYEDMTTDVTAALPGIAAPLTVVVPYGGMLGQEQAKGLYAAAYAGAPHATIVTVADAGHFVMLDQPAAFRAALDTFLKN